MILLAYGCYIVAALDIWTGVVCALRGEKLQAVLAVGLCVMCVLAGRLVMEGCV